MVLSGIVDLSAVLRHSNCPSQIHDCQTASLHRTVVHYRRPIRASGQTMAIYMGKGRVLAVKHPSQDSLKRLYFSHLEEAERAYCDVMLEQGPDYPRRLPLGCGHVFFIFQIFQLEQVCLDKSDVLGSVGSSLGSLGNHLCRLCQ